VRLIANVKVTAEEALHPAETTAENPREPSLVSGHGLSRAEKSRKIRVLTPKEDAAAMKHA
jgi:hypothetical protein